MPPISRSRAPRTTAIATFRARRSAASTAISATRATAPNCISASAPPTIISAPRRRRRAELLAAELEQRLHDPAELAQPGRLRQRHRQRQRLADLERCRRRLMFARSTRPPSTAIRPTRSPATIRAFLCFNDAVTPANGLERPATRPTPSRRARRSARSTAPRPRPPASARRCRRPTPTSCSATTTISSSAAVSTTASPISAPARNWAIVQPDYVVAGSGIFLGPSGNPVSDGPVRCASTNAYGGLYRARHVRRDEGFLDLRRRSSECRQHPVAGSTRRRRSTATTRSCIFNPMIGATYKITSDDHRLCRLFPGQPRADAAGTRLRQSRATLHPRELPRLRSAAEAGGRADLRGGPARNA